MTTLDPFTVPPAGQETAIGFTIRQHGVTPVDLDDVGITIVSPSGASEFFPAIGTGATGHYVANIVFREAGTSRWSVAQGWFAPHDLGTIDIVTPAAIAAPTSGGDEAPALVRYGLPILGTALGAFAVIDIVRTRRRSRVVTT